MAIVSQTSRLNEVIQQLESLENLGDTSSSLESVVVLGRRLALSTIPPIFVRFNAESGPLEPMPQRFRPPFPTLDDLRLSVLQRHQAMKSPSADEEYADDF